MSRERLTDGIHDLGFIHLDDFGRDDFLCEFPDYIREHRGEYQLLVTFRRRYHCATFQLTCLSQHLLILGKLVQRRRRVDLGSDVGFTRCNTLSNGRGLEPPDRR